VRTDEEARQQERAQYIKELEAELKDIRAADVGSGADGFLRHLYKTYPPKNPAHKLNEKDLGEWTKSKKILLTAILHYHPDKQDKEKHGKKWAVFCEEVTKLLNGRYESCKFPPEETDTKKEPEDTEPEKSETEESETENTEAEDTEYESSEHTDTEDTEYEPSEETETDDDEYEETDTEETE